MIKKIISFFGLSKHRKKQESQEYSKYQRLMYPALLPMSKKQLAYEEKVVRLLDEQRYSATSLTGFSLFGSPLVGKHNRRISKK